MRLLVYCKDFYPLETGYANAFRGLCEALVRYNENICIDVVTPVALGDGVEYEKDRIRVVRLRPFLLEDYSSGGTGTRWKTRYAEFVLKKASVVLGNLLNRLYWSRTIVSLHQNNRYDLILFESGTDPLVTGFLPRYVLKKCAIRFHSTGDTEAARYRNTAIARLERIVISKRIAPNVRAILATNSYHLSFIKEFYFGNDPFKCSCRYFGVIDNTVASLDLSRVSPREGQTRRLVTLGRMDAAGLAQKGFEDLLYAIATLSDEDRRCLEVEIIGDGECRGTLEILKSRLNLDNVRFTGRMPNFEVRKRLQQADVVVLLSRFEGRSVFAIEGMLAGCAVLFTNTGGLSDLVRENGWSVGVQDIPAICAALREIVLLNPDELNVLGEQSRRIAEDRFNERTIAVEAYTHLRNIVEFVN